VRSKIIINPVTPLYLVQIGSFITPKNLITNQVIRNWKYAGECADVGGGIIPRQALLRIIEKSPVTNNTAPWVKIALPGVTPIKTLKLSGEEYASAFLSIVE